MGHLRVAPFLEMEISALSGIVPRNDIEDRKHVENRCIWAATLIVVFLHDAIQHLWGISGGTR
jgi:hypothetical protein